MTSQVLNFLWLNLDLPARPDPEDGTIREPLPQKYIANARQAAAANPAADIVLWVDSKRLTEKQFIYLQEALEEGRTNVHLRDLRAIPAYDAEALYNKPETNPKWRWGGKHSLIWRQVDMAKILVSLQGDYDQTFFSDLDHAHVGIRSDEVQTMLKKHGLMIGSYSEHGFGVENQLWGFERHRKGFFESYYKSALKEAYRGYNAHSNLCNKVSAELQTREKIPLKEICLRIAGDGTEAEHTGHEWRKGSGDEATARPAVIAPGEFARLFQARAKRLGVAGKAPAATALQIAIPTTP